MLLLMIMVFSLLGGVKKIKKIVATGEELGATTTLALRGKISHSLLELQHLKSLDLSKNNFHDDITKLRNLSNLQNLDLGYNKGLECENLEWLSHLSLLSHLDLSGVDLSKAIDWVQSINNLPLLKELRLSYCTLPAITTHPSLPFNSSASLSILDLS
ncbi:probably inactive leucine-rich repeat receptor-like protein kinase At3g28040 [Camellia sinensis]|uniref:probably inactive leucine-rich repeat receptor-like protein kinase At3g28040 n=1 Tax=Camellia sinensis TaxID=4442 RepID=UPI001036E35F|nr:probably inactive leucine-rich repeat receptor-like protein kinase At3g28040 [Camellia sinensis]